MLDMKRLCRTHGATLYSARMRVRRGRHAAFAIRYAVIAGGSAPWPEAFVHDTRGDAHTAAREGRAVS